MWQEGSQITFAWLSNESPFPPQIIVLLLRRITFEALTKRQGDSENMLSSFHCKHVCQIKQNVERQCLLSVAVY